MEITNTSGCRHCSYRVGDWCRLDRRLSGFMAFPIPSLSGGVPRVSFATAARGGTRIRRRT